MLPTPRPDITCKKLQVERAFARLGIGILLSVLASSAGAAETARDKTSRFLPYVELAPFEVNGEQLAVSIHARTKSDRKYARKFAEEVIGIAYETMETTTGHGLLIIGRKGEPHPVFIYRKFLALSEASQLNPEVAALAPALTHMLEDWENKFDFKDDSTDGPDIDFDMIVNAVPLPLEGVGSKLYQMAWADDFDMERFGLRLTSLTTNDLQTDELARFEWVFYLPPKSAFSDAMKEVVPKMIAKSDLGFFQRMAVRSALTIFKPLLKKAIEGARKGMLYLSVLRAMSDYSEGDIEALTGSYVQAMMPFGGNDKYDTPLAAIEAQKIKNEEYAKNPFVPPDPLETPDYGRFASFEGGYSGNGKDVTHRFEVDDEVCTWKYLDREATVFLPAGDSLFVTEDGQMTIEFLMDDSGEISAVEERRVRRNKTVPRMR